MKNLVIALAWFIAAHGVLSGSASAQSLTEVGAGGLQHTRDMKLGPDGSMWFAGDDAITRITPQGGITRFDIMRLSGGEMTGAEAMAFDKEGNLWFSGNDRIGRLSPQAVVSTFYAGSGVNGLAAGSDGNMWFSQSRVRRIGRITPEGLVTEFRAGGPLDGEVGGITAGPDGNLWFVKRRVDRTGAGRSPARIGRITTQGTVTEFADGISAEADVDSIAAGPDGNLWFTESFSAARTLGVGRITPQGIVSELAFQPDRRTYRSTPIVSGGDGNLWFGLMMRYRLLGETIPDHYLPAVARVTPEGVITQFSPFGPSPPLDASAAMSLDIGKIAADALGNLWLTTRDYTVSGQDKLWRLAPGGLPSARLAMTVSLSPADDPGRFDMAVDRAVKLSTAWMGNSTLPFGVSPGQHQIAANPATGTNGANYTVALGGDCDAQGQVALSAGDSKACVVTIARKPDNARCLAACKRDLDQCMGTAGSIAQRQLCVRAKRECDQGC